VTTFQGAKNRPTNDFKADIERKTGLAIDKNYLCGKIFGRINMMQAVDVASHLADNNFRFNDLTELDDVVLVVESQFDVECGQGVFLDDWHSECVGGELSTRERT
jgi:hypothetical protein